MNRRLHLSKTKHSKFNESGQLAAFYLFSFTWGCSILTAVWALESVVRSQYSVMLITLYTTLYSFIGGFCYKSYFSVGRVPTHPHGVSKYQSNHLLINTRLIWFWINIIYTGINAAEAKRACSFIELWKKAPYYTHWLQICMFSDLNR